MNEPTRIHRRPRRFLGRTAPHALVLALVGCHTQGQAAPPIEASAVGVRPAEPPTDVAAPPPASPPPPFAPDAVAEEGGGLPPAGQESRDNGAAALDGPGLSGTTVRVRIVDRLAVGFGWAVTVDVQPLTADAPTGRGTLWASTGSPWFAVIESQDDLVLQIEHGEESDRYGAALGLVQPDGSRVFWRVVSERPESPP